MNKNPIGANFTGTWSKRSKKFYSDADAWRYYFKPDHSEFYGEKPQKRSKDKGWKNRLVDDQPLAIDVAYVPWAASVRRSTSKQIIDSAFADVYNDEDILDANIIPDEPNLEQIYWFSDIYKTKKSVANNKVTMSPTILHNYSGDTDFMFDPFVKYAKNMFAKNKKTNSNYRHRQQFQQIWWYDAIEKELEKLDVADSIRLESEDTKSQLEEILENKPHIVWSSKDENKTSQWKAA